MDGWGGRLAAAVRAALAGESALTLRPVGAGLEKRGEFEVRAAGAGLDDEGLGEAPDTPDSSFMAVRERAQVVVCVAESETDDAAISLYPLMGVARLAAIDGGWYDPTFASVDPDYPSRSEGALNIVGGFLMSARAPVNL